MKDIEKILKAVGFNLYNGNVPIMIGGRLYCESVFGEEHAQNCPLSTVLELAMIAALEGE